MDAQHVLTASVLDIVFDGRNKEYGAYVLRKEYNKRLYIAMTATAFLVTMLLILYYSGNETVAVNARPKIEPIVEISNIADPQVIKPKIVPPKLPLQPRIRSTRFAGPPVIVKDPPKDERLPENSSLENVSINNVSQDGVLEDDLSRPPETGNGITGIVKNPTEDSSRFAPIEIESTFPDGLTAWIRFLSKTLNYPWEAQSNGIQGSVIVQFIVDTNGAVSNVEALSGPEELKNEAIRVIKKSGNWIPAIQNGRKVKSYKRQPITFRLMNE